MSVIGYKRVSTVDQNLERELCPKVGDGLIRRHFEVA